MRFNWLRLSPDPGDGGTPPDLAGKTADQNNLPVTGQVTVPPGAPPPVATIAATGTRTEKELELERKLKAREIEASELSDKLRSEKLAREALEKSLQGHTTITAPKEKFSWMGFGNDSSEG